MRLRTVQSSSLKVISEVLKELVNDVNLVFDTSGMSLVCTNGARCVLIDLKLNAENFEEFWCPNPTRIGLNMTSFHKLLKTCSVRDTLTLSIANDKSNELNFEIGCAEKNATTRFNLKLLDVDYVCINAPSVDFDCVATMSSGYFQKTLRDMSALTAGNPVVVIEARKDSTISMSTSGDFASQETVVGVAEGTNIQVQTDDWETIRGSYSLKFLTQFAKTSALSGSVDLMIKREYPLVVRFAVAGLGYVRYIAQGLVEDDMDA